MISRSEARGNPTIHVDAVVQDGLARLERRAFGVLTEMFLAKMRCGASFDENIDFSHQPEFNPGKVRARSGNVAMISGYMV